jgi:cytochrome c553
MRLSLRPRMRRLLVGALAGVATVAVGLFLIAWSGLYNIGASRGHWPIVEWFLTFGMENSVETQASHIEPPPLDDVDLYRLGAGHYQGGCAACHGAPGAAGSVIAQRMLPPPPNLASAAKEWKDRELFWIIKHGIKYTGMPAWASQARDDEVWAVVAFVRRLPALDARTYHDWAWGGLQPPSRSTRELPIEGEVSGEITACARCHGLEGRRPASNLVPVLHGQPSEFLALALRAYAKASRQSGIMQPVAGDHSEQAISQLADFYSRLPPPPAKAQPPADGPARERGRVLATEGAPGRRTPPCIVCHGAEALTIYPRLAGQNAAYMKNRLRRWKSGFASNTETEAIMAPIARLLDERQIDDVSAYFAGLPAAAAPRRP